VYKTVVLEVPVVEVGIVVGQEVHKVELLELVAGVLEPEVVVVQVVQVILHHSSHKKQIQSYFYDHMNRKT